MNHDGSEEQQTTCDDHAQHSAVFFPLVYNLKFIRSLVFVHYSVRHFLDTKNWNAHIAPQIHKILPIFCIRLQLGTLRNTSTKNNYKIP